MDHSVQLAESGYTKLDGLLSEDCLVSAREAVDVAIEFAKEEGKDPFQESLMSHRVDQGVLYDVFQRHPEFAPMVYCQSVLDILETVMGANIYLYVNTLIYKPKGASNEVPWHQDFLSRPGESEKYIVWFALDDATRDNGCLKIIPGAHQTGFLKFHQVPGETHHSRLDPGQMDESNAKYIEARAGDAIIFSQYLPHGSDRSNSEKPRRAFRAAYKRLDTGVVPRGTPVMVRGGCLKV